MSPFVYLALHKAKNKFLELLRKPLKLIVVAGFVILIVLNFSLSEGSPAGERPIVEFKAIISAFYILCFVTETKKGFQSGGTMFSMADVNLLFMSPVKPFTVLFYGMLSRLGSSVFMGAAFIYQFALLRSYYPIEAADMIAAVIGYGAVVFFSQLAGMLVYFYTCGEQKKIKIARLLLYLMCAVFLAAFVIRLAKTAFFSASSVALAVTDYVMGFFPVAGWVFTAVDGFMQNDTVKILLGTAPCVFFSVFTFIVLAFSKHGYYEDVLLSCEKNSDKKSEGNTRSEVKVRVNDIGLKKGSGASSLFFKHLLENRRTKSALFSPTSLFYLVLIGVYGFVFDGDFIMLFSFSCMVSFLPVLSGRWIKELSMPYVYLIPASPFKKLFYILPEMLPKIFTESVLQCALIGYLCRLSVITVLFITIARISVSFVLTATALLMARIFREKEKNNIFIAMSVLPGIVFVLPSVFICMAALNFGLGFIIAFTAMAAVNIPVSLVLLFFARNLLKNI